jgi:hypothetical protein
MFQFLYNNKNNNNSILTYFLNAIKLLKIIYLSKNISTPATPHSNIPIHISYFIPTFKLFLISYFLFLFVTLYLYYKRESFMKILKKHAY